ncbi:hypothetical protein NQ176_g11415 [Zarea fungicola]|uniref:Uncharacterized protein n=1 Tax=Zarea fungicola TaxID=93591 RepID=A0ACC1MCF3_9HYPO|nr:hypothetical protein NQ176_g11415 [Lecanicillium fungicola]
MEPHKAKKGLPFLKNPMSTLLMRRRLNQNIPEALPLPVSSKEPEPAYDPRIKGTRVHDFSAPRRRSIQRNDPLPPLPVQGDHQDAPVPEPAAKDTTQQAPVRQHQEVQSPPAASSSGMRNGSFRDRMRSSSGSSMSGSMQYDTLSSIAESNATRGSATYTRTNPSTRTTRSRKISLSEMSSKDTLPRHMKSTSSRFSFDMIGAAKQEKIMEERHRQRQLEKGEPEQDERRDSRFDDFDDDGFDYDAMMDDDGLEERIPGVNADFDEEVEYYEEEIPYTQQDDYNDDPDNDQENFAGFVFQRSDPSSSLGSPYTPGQLPTPRDAQGQAIGSAVTKDTPTLPGFPLSAESNVGGMELPVTQQLAGLEIDKDTPPREEATMATAAPVLDDLYFDDGIIGYEDEFAEDLAAEFDPNAEPFDESIFDDNDTDNPTSESLA